jgi:tetratricopeptide (TPR) repeat protein
MVDSATPFRRTLIVVGLALVLPFIVYETLLISGAIPPLTQEQGGAIVERLILFAFAGGIATIVGGFALAFFVARRGTVDVDQIIRDFAANQGKLDAIARLAELEDSKAFRAAVMALVGQSNDPSAPRGINRAIELLRQGETGAAEAALAEILDRRLAERSTASQEAAEAARHLGALAYLSDTARALYSYRTATDLDPNDTWSWIYLGRLYKRAGNLAAAEQAFQKAREAAERADNARDIMAADIGLGDVRVAQGDRAGALQAFEQGRAIRDKLAQRDPNNAEWQRDLIVSHVKLAEVAVQEDAQLSQAERHYRTALDVAVALRDRGRLAPVDEWLVDALQTRLEQVRAHAAR